MNSPAKPTRYQRSRQAGARLPDGVICVTRPGKWGNPFATVVDFRAMLEECMGLSFSGLECTLDQYTRMGWIASNIEELRGKDLACFCPLDKPCHADVLIELANRPRS